MSAPPPLQEFLTDLLVEQQRLQTPVARLAALHQPGHDGQAGARSNRTAIPLTTPGPGEQYAFEVDLDACSGCKACVAGCHALNGLDDEETWRDTGLLVGGSERHPFQQTITTACHHCADPACLNGCPVLAYEKDPVTGIVRHLDDQCIGCSYCILKCPYDVPKYSARLGIVRKCDLCHQRLSAGEAPACVQACPTQAIKVVTVTLSVRPSASTVASPETTTLPAATTAAPAFLPAAPDPSYTRPTTRYVSKRGLPPDLRPADRNTLRPQPAHWPLVIMLVCTQAALGLQVADLVARPGTASIVTQYVTLPLRPLGGAAVALLAVGLAASVAHLGQPFRAWRIFLGLRRSWLSREAVLFGVWFPALVFSVLLPRLGSGLIAATLGSAGVFCSVMIYADTRRRAWRAGPSLARFFGTAGVTAVAALAAARPDVTSLVTLALALGTKLLLEARAARPAGEHEADAGLFPELATARLLTGRFRPVLGLRVVAAAAGWLALLARVDQPAGDVTHYVTTAGALALLLAGELAERYLYFRTVDAPRMPGYAAGSPSR